MQVYGNVPVSTEDDVAEQMGVSHYTVIVWLRRGWLKGHKYGKAWRGRPPTLRHGAR